MRAAVVKAEPVPGQLDTVQPLCRAQRVQRAWVEVEYSYRMRRCLFLQRNIGYERDRRGLSTIARQERLECADKTRKMVDEALGQEGCFITTTRTST